VSRRTRATGYKISGPRHAGRHPIENDKIWRRVGEPSYGSVAAIDAFDDIAFGLEIVRERDGERDIALDDRDARVGRAPTSMSLDMVHRDVLLPLNVACCKFRTNRNGPQPSSWHLPPEDKLAPQSLDLFMRTNAAASSESARQSLSALDSF
jgi:hypothetical protein